MAPNIRAVLLPHFSTGVGINLAEQARLESGQFRQPGWLGETVAAPEDAQ